MPERPLQHRDPEKKDDETLQKEARAHLASEPALQLVAELIAELREIDVPWWTPVRLRERWGAVERMRWFRERSDLRQRITSALTGLAPKAARRKTSDFQGALIDSVIDEGDITPRSFEEAFRPYEIAVYGPAGAYWQYFRESMPWDQGTQVHQELMAWLLKSLLADRSRFDGIGRTPILTPWDVRSAIDGRIWHTRMPLEIRVAIDNARLQQERDRPGVPFHADRDLAIAAPEIIASNVPLRDLIPVLQAAQKSMRFDPPKTSGRDAAQAPALAPASGRDAAQAPASGKLENAKTAAPEPAARPHDVVSASSPPPPLAPASPASTPPPTVPQLVLEPMSFNKPLSAPPPPPLVAPLPPVLSPLSALTTPLPSVATPLPPLATPPSPLATPPPPLATPLPPLATPPPPLATPLPSLATPPPPLATPLPSLATPMPPVAPPPFVPPASSLPSSPPPATSPASPGVLSQAGSPLPPTSVTSPKAVADAIAPPPWIDPARMAPPRAPESGAPARPDSAAAEARSRGTAARSAPSSAGASAILAVLNSIDPDDDLERTNPYSVPSDDEIAAESATLTEDASPDGAGKRRRGKA
jgi:hypothetical protein